ncbi:protein of unknown function [Arachidicoccus rhizosphaerae]|uniref:DUF1543 domain-containing protein n=2 Tax=Arachidicoccus rhizosphaerae TaxID=551991 RepID=A0A1H3W1X1_9BACT|nr:protein of unknown function [Arachidicoccus rhizosphaerae]
MCLIGCKPEGRHIEQHDIFFGIAADAEGLTRQMEAFWPEGGKLHLDAWRRVTRVGDVAVTVEPRTLSPDKGGKANEPQAADLRQLYFINMGGYQPAVFEEYHYKLLTVQKDKPGAIRAAKQSEFYKQAAGSHIDDQYGVDIDDLYNVEDILAPELKEKFYLSFQDLPKEQQEGDLQDDWHIGYTKLSQLQKII